MAPTDQCQNDSSNLLTQYREQPHSTWIVVAYPRPAFSATKRINHADQQAQVSQGDTSCRNMVNCNTEVHGGGGLELAKPAREPASSCPKPCASLKKAPENFPARRSLLALVKRKQTVVRDRLSLRNLPVCAFDSRAQGFCTPLARRRSSGPLSSPNLVLSRLIARAAAPYQTFRDSAPSLSRFTTSRRAPNWSSEEAHLINAIINEPNHRRLSTDRPSREDGQLAASLEGEPSPTPAGETLPKSYPKTRFRKKRARCNAWNNSLYLYILHNICCCC